MQIFLLFRPEEGVRELDRIGRRAVSIADGATGGYTIRRRG